MSNSPENWISEVSVVEGLENIYSLPPNQFRNLAFRYAALSGAPLNERQSLRMEAYKAKFTQELVSRWGKGEVSTTFVQYFEPNVTEESLSKSALCHLVDGVEAYLQLMAEDLFVKPPQFTENTIHMQPSFATTDSAFKNRVPLFYGP